MDQTGRFKTERRNFPTDGVNAYAPGNQESFRPPSVLRNPRLRGRSQEGPASQKPVWEHCAALTNQTCPGGHSAMSQLYSGDSSLEGLWMTKYLFRCLS